MPSSQLSDADRIAAEGVEITLGGKVRHLRYGMRALRYIENQFGGIGAFVQRLQQTEWGEDRLRAICAGMTAGLLHEKPAEMALSTFEESIEDLLDFDALIPWIDAMTRSLTQSLPQGKGGGNPKAMGRHEVSPGNASTISRRSNMAAARKRSGT